VARAGVGVLHSSDEAPEIVVERRRGSCADACEAERERGDDPQGIPTPTVPETATGVRKLQRTLYRQAKSKPKWKAWSLYGDVCRREVLEAAFWQVSANGGAPGVDGVRGEDLAEDDGHRELWLAKLQSDLRGRYADDFVVLCRKGQGAEMHRRLKSWQERRGLKLNEKKTRIVDFEKESFEFLGFRLAWRKARSGKSYPHCEPSPKSCGKLREAIRGETARSTQWKEAEEVIARVNRRVRGWIGCFHYANSGKVFSKLQWQTRARIRRWLWKKHAKTKEQYGEAFSNQRLHDHYGLINFPMYTKW